MSSESYRSTEQSIQHKRQNKSTNGERDETADSGVCQANITSNNGKHGSNSSNSKIEHGNHDGNDGDKYNGKCMTAGTICMESVNLNDLSTRRKTMTKEEQTIAHGEISHKATFGTGTPNTKRRMENAGLSSRNSDERTPLNNDGNSVNANTNGEENSTIYHNIIKKNCDQTTWTMNDSNLVQAIRNGVVCFIHVSRCGIDDRSKMSFGRSPTATTSQGASLQACILAPGDRVSPLCIDETDGTGDSGGTVEANMCNELSKQTQSQEKIVKIESR